MAKDWAPTEKQTMVVRFLQDNEGKFFGDEIAGQLELNPKGIHGVMNGLVKNEIVQKEKVQRTVARKSKDGEMVDKEVEATVYFLTEAGTELSLDA